MCTRFSGFEILGIKVLNKMCVCVIERSRFKDQFSHAANFTSKSFGEYPNAPDTCLSKTHIHYKQNHTQSTHTNISNSVIMT